jgi:hypothetical protein
MLKFREFRETTEKVVKSFKVKKYVAAVKQSGSKYIAYLDGDKLDEFTTAKAAEQAIKDFVELMGK